MSTSISSSSVDGLVSGLDTSSIISALVNADAVQQTRLKSSVTAAQSKASAYQSVNTKVSALQTAAEALTKASAWGAAKATSSSDAVAVTSTGAATAGSVTVEVAKLATGRSVLSKPVTNDAAGLTDLGLPMVISRDDGTSLTLTPSMGTLSDVAAAINKATKLGVNAVAIRMADDTYRLQITSARTGQTEGKFNITQGEQPGGPQVGDSVFKPVTPAANAEFYLLPSGPSGLTGQDGKPVRPDNAIQLISPSNTYSGIMAGVSFTAAKPGVSTLSVAPDPAGLADSVKGLVDAANAALAEIGKQSKAGVAGASGAAATGAGVLRSDATLRTLQGSIVNAVTSALGGSASTASFGLQFTREGSFSFDKDKFLTAYAADPLKVQGLVSGKSLPVDPVTKAANPEGVADRLLAVTKAATDSTTGSLVMAAKGQTNSITRLNEQIAQWDERLSQKRARYEKYYAALEVSLGKVKSQASWLSGQLASLG
ncbi:flagellar filament capping protein FliD [Kineococcus indalonis]|uniref:flagellar filament capping protein FliD n=1 Tax=Kineococcus indalonis TaxID=2696566 RepID=UPI0014134973|nr:flagellar filament capping protein FliD [Kineococcus indalonis]NAZ86320.1 flagellar filament capping protein FliD [Kineococcus indalonis]